MLPGGVLVVETPSRASAGAHYTPKDLAEEVVRYALEPLVYDPGPHQRADNWVPVDSDRILSLKVADSACGSGAFLVAAANYLAKRLVEALQREGETRGMTPREQEVHAIRTVIAKKCNIEGIDLPTESLKIAPSKNGYSVHITYESRAPYLAGIYLLLEFDKQVEIKK